MVGADEHAVLHSGPPWPRIGPACSARPTFSTVSASCGHSGSHWPMSQWGVPERGRVTRVRFRASISCPHLARQRPGLAKRPARIRTNKAPKPIIQATVGLGIPSRIGRKSTSADVLNSFGGRLNRWPSRPSGFDRRVAPDGARFVSMLLPGGCGDEDL
jgi:hypothetical protein